MSRRHSTILGASAWMPVSRAARPCASSPWALAASGRPQASSPARAMERRPVRGEEEGFVSALVWSIFVVLESGTSSHAKSEARMTGTSKSPFEEPEPPCPEPSSSSCPAWSTAPSATPRTWWRCCAAPTWSPACAWAGARHALAGAGRSEEHTSELQSHLNLVCRLLLEKKKTQTTKTHTPPSHHTTVTHGDRDSG